MQKLETLNRWRGWGFCLLVILLTFLLGHHLGHLRVDGVNHPLLNSILAQVTVDGLAHYLAKIGIRVNPQRLTDQNQLIIQFGV
jgi:hypothetical protein